MSRELRHPNTHLLVRRPSFVRRVSALPIGGAIAALYLMACDGERLTGIKQATKNKALAHRVSRRSVDRTRRARDRKSVV